MCILGKVYHIIVPHHWHGIPSGMPIFPIDQDFISRVGSIYEMVICDFLEQELLSFILKFIFTLQLHVQTFGDSVVVHDVSSLNLTKND